MLVKKLSGLIVVASALTISACNDNNTPPQGGNVITNPTQPPPPATPAPAPITAGAFASNQVSTLTCVNGRAVEINSVTFADSETPVDVVNLDARCMGGPPT